MTPVISSSINGILLIHGTPFTTTKTRCLKRCNLLRISTKQTWSSQKYVLPLSTSVRLIPQFASGFFLQQKSRIHMTFATETETEVAVEEADSPVTDEVSGEASEIPTDAVGTSEESVVKSDASVPPAQIKRVRPTRTSEMPPLKPEELVPGATFTGKVISIQPFGAFVDFGAFTDGLVHVSQLSDSFVKDVGDIVSVGQEVKVRLVEANMETKRISLTMREIDGTSKMQQRKDSPDGGDKGRPPRKGTPRSNQKRDDGKKSFSKFEKGEDLVGTVKNITRSGAFISLPDGEEGFLPSAEEVEDDFRDFQRDGSSSLVVGQEVSVRVLRITRGQVTLTMKTKEEADSESDFAGPHGVIHKATNPFLLAFRKNKDIAAFLDEREKAAKLAERAGIPQTSDENKGSTSLTETELNKVQLQQTSSGESDEIEGKFQIGTKVDEVRDQQESSNEGLVSTLSVDDETSSNEVGVEASTVDASNEEVNHIKVPEIIVSDSSDGINGAVQSIEEVTAVTSGILASEESVSPSVQLTEEAPAGDQISSENHVGKEVTQFSTSLENMVSDSLLHVDSVAKSIEEKLEDSSTVLSPETASNASVIEEVSTTGGLENVENVDLSAQVTDSIMSDSASISDQVTREAPGVDQSSSKNQVGEEVIQLSSNEGSPENMFSDSLQSVDSVVRGIEEKAVFSSEVLSPEVDSAIEEVSTTDGLENAGKADLSEQLTDSIIPDSAISGEETQIPADDTPPKDEVQMATPRAEIDSAAVVEELGINPDRNGSITSSTVQQSINEESQVILELEKEIDNFNVQNELKDETPAADSVISTPALVEDEKVGSVPDENSIVTNSNGQSIASSPKESTTTAADISPALVKRLRDETGAGMMDCKKALSETEGDLVKAQEFLRKKGLASADKKASRATTEGRIGAYIHDSRIGVLIEVNCETDFVSRGEIFKELVDDLAMQVAACPQVQYLVTDDVPNEILEKEREIEMQKEDLLSKPEQIRSRIVDGRIRKRLEELALLEQPYIKNDKLVVKDWVKQTIATIGENIKVNRFVRFNLGEGLEKKSQDFAAEVAAQTAAKPVVPPSQGKEQPAVFETVEQTPKATISAALVKQLREETGAGMMDCKKALSETEGDLVKAQEYLRKKGLSTADKKSSRLATEGRIGSYVHDSRIGVLIEVNCETDFVGRGEKFKELVDDLAMQVVACPQVQYVSVEDIPESIVRKEKELEMQREDLQSKPENIRERIVEGRISKRLSELALLEQPFIKDDSILVKQTVKQTVAALGENIKVRRFVRFTLGDVNETGNEA